MLKKNAAIINNSIHPHKGNSIDYAYGQERLEVIKNLCNLHPQCVTSENIAQELPALKDVEVIFSCWLMIPLTAQQLDQLPNLKVVFYASGTVHGFAKPFIERGVIICNAVSANAIPVAEFCLAQIILGCKGVHRNSTACRQGPWKEADMPSGRGIYGETVALLGIGAVSRHLLTLLKPLKLRIIAVCEYLSPEQARELGIDALVTIEEAFREAYVISNQLADKPDNVGVLTEALFTSMRPGATFINTGRGAQVNEPGLIAAFKARPDLTAILDVQHPEPPVLGSDLFNLPNIHMNSHLAGSNNDEVRRLADCMIDEFQRWQAGQPLLYQVDPLIFAARA